MIGLLHYVSLTHLHSEMFEPRIAIRYLGRILECPAFWTQISHSNHWFVTKKVVQWVKQLVEDLDLEHATVINVLLVVSKTDLEGTDIIMSAVLEGAGILDGEAQLQSGPLLDDFERLFWLLHQ